MKSVLGFTLEKLEKLSFQKIIQKFSDESHVPKHDDTNSMSCLDNTLH